MKLLKETCLALLLTLPVVGMAQTPPASAGPPRRAVSPLMAPLHFEAGANATSPVKYTARRPGFTLSLTPNAAALSLREPPKNKNGVPGAARTPRSATLRMMLLGASAAPEITGMQPLPGKTNYLIGSDPKRWRTGVATYGKVRYRGVYPGIDLVYYGAAQRVEHDFIVAPGASPKAIRLQFAGMSRLGLDKAGSLVANTTCGAVRWLAPTVYQNIGGKKRLVSARYTLRGGRNVGFQIGRYDVRRPLVIDPVIDYATYLGGSDNDWMYGMATDGAGNVWVAGPTSSVDFPTLNPAQAAHGSAYWNGYVAKFDPAGNMLYSTYLGGSNGDECYDLAIDSAGSAYVTGYTYSRNFPVTSGAYQTTFRAANQSAYVTKLSATGGMVYSTLYSGTYQDQGERIAVDSAGSAYITGISGSALPTTAGAYRTTRSSSDWNTYVAKFSPDGKRLVYGTYIGGSRFSWGLGLAVNAAGEATVAGSTSSRDFPTTPGAIQTAHKGAIFYKTGNATAAPITWAASETGLNGADIHALVIDPKTPSTLYAAQDDGTYKSVDSGATWARQYNGYVSSLYIDPNNSSVLYATNSRGVIKSGDGGVTWLATGFYNTAAANGLAFDPTTSATLYAATDNGVYKSADSGAVWTQISGGLPNNGSGYFGVNSVAVDPKTPATLYAATYQGMYKTTNGGQNWSGINSGLPYNGTVPYAVRLIVINPSNPAIVYVKSDYRNSLMKTLNGTTWNFSGIVNVNSFTLDPKNPNIVYCGNYDGVFKSVNGAANILNSSLNRHRINAIAVDPTNSSKIYVGTWLDWDVYATKLNASGSGLIFSTYLGGDRFDWTEGVTSDSSGNLYLAMQTESANFPTLNAYQPLLLGTRNAGVVKISPTGTLLYSTFLGGTNFDSANAIATDRFGNAYVTGWTYSADFPTTADAYQNFNAGNADAFVTKISPDGSTLLYSSFLGGEGYDDPAAIAADDFGNIFVGGHTESFTFPTMNAGQNAMNGPSDAFLVKIRMTPQLTVTPTLTRNGNFLDLTLTFVNSGGVDLANIQTLTAKLNTTAPMTALPQSVGTLLIGQTATLTLRFSGVAGVAGKAGVLRLSGSYPGGVFGGSYRIQIP